MCGSCVCVALWKGFNQSYGKCPESLFYHLQLLMTDLQLKKTNTNENINVKQSTALHQRPYIPHFHVHADTLGEVFFICDSAAGLSLREITVDCSKSQSFFWFFSFYNHHDLLIKKMGNEYVHPALWKSSPPLTMVHSVFLCKISFFVS